MKSDEKRELLHTHSHNIFKGIQIKKYFKKNSVKFCWLKNDILPDKDSTVLLHDNVFIFINTYI